MLKKKKKKKKKEEEGNDCTQQEWQRLKSHGQQMFPKLSRLDKGHMLVYCKF